MLNSSTSKKLRRGFLYRFWPIIFLPLLCFTTFSCNKNNPSNSWMEEPGKVRAIATIAQIGDLAAEIGGERANVSVLIHGSLDPHSYEMVKGDDEKLERADLIFYNGLGLEHGASLSEWLRTSGKALAVGDSILKRSPEKILRKGGVLDPHLWMDVSLWSEALDPIAKAFADADPEGADYYYERAGALKLRMEAAHLEIRTIMHHIPPERRYLVTSHDAFQYFTRSYLAESGEENWQERFEAPEGLAPDGQLSTADIRRIVEYLKSHGISILFPESNVSRDSIRKIASVGKKMGLSVRICKEPLYGDAMDGENLHYLDMMRHNAETISRHLGAIDE